MAALQETLQEEAAAINLLEGATWEEIEELTPLVQSFLLEFCRWFGNPVIGLEVRESIEFYGTTLNRAANVFVLNNHMNTSDALRVPTDGVPSGPDDAQPFVFNARRHLIPNDDIDNTEKESWKCAQPKTYDGSYGGFGFGACSCPGHTYAQTFMRVLLIQILQSFALSLQSNDDGNAYGRKPNQSVGRRIIFDQVLVPRRRNLPLTYTWQHCCRRGKHGIGLIRIRHHFLIATV